MTMRLTAFLIMTLVVASALGQRTTRPKLKLEQWAEATVDADTVARASIAVSGYEKTLKSTKESLLATNQGTDTVAVIGITIDYLDMEGRQLHRRALRLTSADPMAPGQTRQFEFKSWDAQRVWYYRLSEPARTKGQATPYDVKVNVDYALKSPAPQKK